MSNDDWYRLQSWSEEDKVKFFDRLNRSRSNYNKAQYARIQAGYLEAIGTPEMLKNSIELLNQIFNKWPAKEVAASILPRGILFN